MYIVSPAMLVIAGVFLMFGLVEIAGAIVTFAGIFSRHVDDFDEEDDDAESDEAKAP